MTIEEETRLSLENDINPLAWHYSLVRNGTFGKLPPAEIYPGRPRVEEAKQKPAIHVSFFRRLDQNRNVKEVKGIRGARRVV